MNQEENISTTSEPGEELQEEKEFDDLDMKYEIKISISRRDLLTLILAFALRFKVSDTAIVYLIEMLNIIFGKKFISPSLYNFWKVFDFNKEKVVTTHFFCEKCYMHLSDCQEKQSIVCKNCGDNVQTGNSTNSFMSISLSYQIKKLIKSGIINFSFLQNFNQFSQSTNYSDINDGKLYQKLKNSAKSVFLTFNFCVDGLAIYNNAKGSLWPILVTVNEIPPAERFKNVLLAGLWFGKKEPKMDLYLKPFVEQTIKLAQDGISLAENPEFATYPKLKVFAACCLADSVARPCLQNSTQFNGYYGCSWCKHPGFFVNNCIKYIYKNKLLYDDRLEDETVVAMSNAMTMGKSVQGIKGPSALLPVPFFNVITNFVPDYMHGIFLGVVKYLVNSWFDSRHKAQEFYIGTTTFCILIDERLKKIIFPKNVGRVPRSIGERNLYKASEWRNFLLYAFYPCLKGILNQSYLDHFSLLASAVDLLLKDNITVDSLETADKLLMKFVIETQVLYGEDFMTYNMHLLLHLTSSVANWGPLWCHSMFVYEGYNATLLSYIMGTCGIKTQAIKRFLLNQELITSQNSFSIEVSNFISKINSKSKVLDKVTQIGSCNLYGAPHKQIKDVCCIDFPTYFLLKYNLSENSEIFYFKRMTVRNILFTVKGEKQFKMSDSFIYTESEIGKIVFIAFHRNMSKIVVCINRYEIVKKLYKNLNMYIAKKSNSFLIFNVEEIIGKCTEYIDNDQFVTVSKVPVSYELST